MTNPHHSKKSNEHYTPLEYIEAARAVMGGIDLDPATTAEVNFERLRAEHYFTQADDGLAQRWTHAGGAVSRVFLNPPGGLVGRRSSAAVWWDKLIDEYAAGRVEQAIFIGFSLEVLTTTQGSPDDVWPGEFPFCVPRSRIKFVTADGAVGTSPTHGNIIVFVPPQSHEGFAVEKFEAVFSPFGKVRT